RLCYPFRTVATAAAVASNRIIPTYWYRHARRARSKSECATYCPLRIKPRRVNKIHRVIGGVSIGIKGLRNGDRSTQRIRAGPSAPHVFVLPPPGVIQPASVIAFR